MEGSLRLISRRLKLINGFTWLTLTSPLILQQIYATAVSCFYQLQHIRLCSSVAGWRSNSYTQLMPVVSTIAAVCCFGLRRRLPST